MKARITGVMIAAAALVSCGGLPQSLKDDIASEHQRFQQAERQVKTADDAVRDAFSRRKELFAGTPVINEWPSALNTSKADLERARSADQELARLVKDSGREGVQAARNRAERLLREARDARSTALRNSDSVQAGVRKWLDFDRDLPKNLAKLQSEYDAVHTADLSAVTKTIQKAGQDWPGKKADLDSRLAGILAARTSAEEQWKGTEAARKSVAAGQVTGAAVATLLQADEALAAGGGRLTGGASELTGLSGQLYDAWDKILVDLDKNGDGSGREKIKLVKTHYVDVPLKKTEITSDESWSDISPAQLKALEDDMGMAIAHKDAGLYDSEAHTTPQPAGFAYMATPEQGRNQYGYWSNAGLGGGSVWTWLPQYLIMRELFWGRNHYQPIYINEFNGYRSAVGSGRSYYGQETPSAAPKYGSRGTFTGKSYASSRYVQSGGFRGSGYSSPGSSTSSSRTATQPRPSSGSVFGNRDSSAGRRFGGGSSSGSRSAPSAGRRFGGGGGSRSPARSFGGRRR